MAKRELELLGEGKQHRVFALNNRPDLVFKVPKFKQALGFRLFGFRSADARQDFIDTNRAIGDTHVFLPKTRILRFRKGLFVDSYVIVQQRLKEDNSIHDKEELLKGNQFLLDKYALNPTNFLSQDNKLYFIDPIQHNTPRLLSKLLRLDPIRFHYYQTRINLFFRSLFF